MPRADGGICSEPDLVVCSPLVEGGTDAQVQRTGTEDAAEGFERRSRRALGLDSYSGGTFVDALINEYAQRPARRAPPGGSGRMSVAITRASRGGWKQAWDRRWPSGWNALGAGRGHPPRALMALSLVR